MTFTRVTSPLHPFRRRRFYRPLTAGLLVALLPLLGASPASAHRQRHLAATILSVEAVCDEELYPYCRAEGLVKITNGRSKRTRKIAICVGIEVHTEDEQNLSYEPPTPHGQAIAVVRPGRSETVSYRAGFNAEAGVADHVHVMHVHKSVVHDGGEQC